jgi:DNA-binding SARP family transcriptional activator
LDLEPLAAETARRSTLEHQTRAATIRRLVVAVEEQRRRLDTQMGEALEVLARAASGTPGPTLLTGDESPGPGRVMIRCLGSLTVQAGSHRVTRWRSGKARALFEYLVTHRGRVVSRDVLIEVLWPDPDAAASAVSLKVAVHALRQVLAELNESLAARLVIEAHESGYQLIAGELWLDVDEFEHCCALAARLDTAGRTAEALTFYEYACDLYGGDFLGESVDDWAVFRRESLKDQYLFALARLADAAINAADYRGCILRCRQLLELDRFREDTFRTLMICHARLGQPGRVRRWYELCVQTLHDELDVRPSAETVRVYERALHGGLTTT